MMNNDVAIVGIKDIRTGISESALTDSSDAIRKHFKIVSPTGNALLI